MPHSLPPLRALVAFEAAVRHASFKLAAEEMSLTPGAVSQQIKKLEQWLGVTLFLRQTRQLQVTDAGMDYYRAIAPALEQIRQVSHSRRQQSTTTVKLSLSPTLAAKWLAPRMTDFIVRHPQIDVHINATNRPVDFQRESVDLAIRYFDGQDPSLEVQPLFPDEILLLCSPRYRDRLRLTSPAQLADATLLHVSLYQNWDEWLARFTPIEASARQKIPGLHFDQALLGLEAAKRDQGVVLSNRLLAGEELKRGELVEPFPLRLPTPKGYYLVHPRRRPLSEAAAHLKAWLLTQMATNTASA